MKNLEYLIVIAVLAPAITPSLAFGQTVYSTGTQGCCDLLDPHYTLVAAPQGVTLGNVYSSPLASGCCGSWVTPLPGSWWIDPTGTADWNSPFGNYTYQQTFTLDGTAGAMLTGEFSSDNQSCVTLNGGPEQCTLGGGLSYLQYTPFTFTTGFQVGINSLDFVVYNDGGPTGLEVVVNPEKKLYSFGHGSDGTNPQAGLVSDAAGNLYGTTYDGGNNEPCCGGAGTVFELTPNGDGTWTEKVLYDFIDNGADGTNPVAGLIFDAAGNLYGTTSLGGTYGWGQSSYGDGTVFELTPSADGTWTEKVLHSFGNGTDGINPGASLIFDATGDLYGTTTGGGIHDSGTVFELSPGQGGGWTEKVLHSFNPNGADGASPAGSLIFDAAGNLYGTTSSGGAYGAGTAFELTRNQDGNWEEPPRLRHFGHDLDGLHPYANLIFDAAGNLYGTTWAGGGHNQGTVFELTPVGGGRWSEKQVHDFVYGTGGDGQNPPAALIFDAAGHLYGTTYQGGTYNAGTVFEITP